MERSMFSTEQFIVHKVTPLELFMMELNQVNVHPTLKARHYALNLACLKQIIQ
jgi:hypothetical protein